MVAVRTRTRGQVVVSSVAAACAAVGTVVTFGAAVNMEGNATLLVVAVVAWALTVLAVLIGVVAWRGLVL